MDRLKLPPKSFSLVLGSVAILFLNTSSAEAYPVAILKQIDGKWEKYCSGQFDRKAQLVTTAKHCLEVIDINQDEPVTISLEELELSNQRIIPLDKLRNTYPEMILNKEQRENIKLDDLRIYGYRMEKRENILSYFLELATKAEQEFQEQSRLRKPDWQGTKYKTSNFEKFDDLIFRIISKVRSAEFHSLIAGNSGSALEYSIKNKTYRIGAVSYAGFYITKSCYVVGFALNGGGFLELRLSPNDGFAESLYFVDKISI
jgi:hypothetical protein